MDFQQQYGPWALITGASAGFGELFARRLAARGLNVVLLARRREKLEALAADIESAHGVQARVVAADLSAPDFLEAVAEQTKDLEIGLLVNNAGFTNSGDFLDNDLAAEIRLVDVNCRAAMILAHHFGTGMRARRRGGMIFSASVAGFSAIPFWSNYAASKGFDLLLAEGLHNELKRHNVDVLAMCPGATHTEFASYTGALSKVMTMHAEPVVDGALNALGRRRTWVAGWLNKMNVFLMRFFPRKLNSMVAGTLIRDIVDH